MSTETNAADPNWLSEGLVDLQHRLTHDDPAVAPHPDTGLHCDVLIVGSGYGAAVCAMHLGEAVAQDPSLRVWLLERGKAYLPGEFPNQLAHLPGHVRFDTPHAWRTRGARLGLFDMRVGDDVSVLLATGLGGGSLINAGVMDWPEDEVFRQPPWPRAIADDLGALRERAGVLKQWLGAADPQGRDNTVEHAPAALSKFAQVQRIGQAAQAKTAARFRPTPITVAMEDGVLPCSGVAVQACRHCGDCATGCNYGAKISLDASLLARAQSQGVRLVTEATVMQVTPFAGADGTPGWTVHTQHTDPQVQWQQGDLLQIHARRVILAAGTLGSTGILLRSRQAGLAVSHRLGERFSANGDLVLNNHAQAVRANAVATENRQPDERRIGPTITAMVDGRGRRDIPLGDRHVIQDLAVPAAIARVFGELHATAQVVADLSHPDLKAHHTTSDESDPLAVDPAHMDASLPLAIIGHDSAEGRIELTPPQCKRDEPASDQPILPSDSTVRVAWPGLRNDPRFDRQVDELAALIGQSGLGGTLLPNPGWKPVPRDMEFLVDGKRGPLFTAHPLGGCAMGSSAQDGVVDHLGRVFLATAVPGDAGTACHDGLVVLDGSVMASSLGINPSLTIAALADRAITKLMPLWGLGASAAAADASALSSLPTRQRPMVPPEPMPAHHPTCIEITEQMQGEVGGLLMVLRLSFKEVAIPDLLAPRPIRRTLTLDPQRSEVRLIDAAGCAPHEVMERGRTVLRARLHGELHALHRKTSGPIERLLRGGHAWFFNRGARDMAQQILQHLTHLTPPDQVLPEIGERIQQGLSLASRAGEVRQMQYVLTIGEVMERDPAWMPSLVIEGGVIRGHKHFTYARRSNPWHQLTHMTLAQAPWLDPKGCQLPTLELDLAYLANIGIPLMRITRLRDMPSALMDVAGLVLLFLRLLLNIHVWSMRAVDEAPAREPRRLPGHVPGLPTPLITELDTDAPLSDGTPVRIRLTRYPARQPGRHPRPLVMIHGYSASGTTFAHHSVDPGLARFMWDRGHDVWLLDMRTSAGMPTATYPWHFEDPAHRDIPVALAYVADACQSEKVDVFAHCMGSAMLWMALLARDEHEQGLSEAARQALRRLQGKGTSPNGLIHRLAMSQITPHMQFVGGNVLRAFIAHYVREHLPLGPYRFRPEPNDSETNEVLDQILQRLLATLPYPQEEFDVEHGWFPPWRTAPWARTRRRMDALYGRDFNIRELDPPVLDFIDDHFGPLNLDTLSQGLHMARSGFLANRQGVNRYLTSSYLTTAMSRMQAMMSIHGTDNGLADLRGMYRFKDYVDAQGPEFAAKYTIHPIEGLGHQDCLIGRQAPTKVFPLIADFFEGVSP